MKRPLPNPPELLTKVLYLAIILIVVTVLYVAREVLIPLALALLFSFLLTPVATRFETWRLGRIPSVLATVFLAFSVVAGIGYLVGGQMIDLTYQLPGYKKNISQKIASLKTSHNSPFARATATVKELGKELEGTAPEPDATHPASALSADKDKPQQVEVVQQTSSLTELVQSVFGPLVGPLGTAAVVVVFVLFMLLKREDLRDRIIHLVGRGQLNITTQALDEAAHKVTGYLFMQLIVNVSFGVPIGIGLFFIGVPNAFLWGLLATLLRFIPYFGAWIALGFPLALSLAISNSWTMPVLTLVLFGSIELITSNVLEPWLYGAHTGLSPVAIMVATIFWTWLWGGVGLLLATPLTVCVAVLGKYIPSLNFLDALLGDEPTLTTEERFYQRLLALDRREASQVSQEYLKAHSLPELYSAVFVPALAAAEREDQQGTLDDRHQGFIFETTRELMEELAAEPVPAKDSASSKADGPMPAPAPALVSLNTIFCVPAADEADEIVALMLAQLLEREGYKAEATSYKALASEVIEQVSEAGCQAVCISATPPHDTMHTRYFCKLLRSKFPTLHIVVGLWDAEQSEDKLARRRERLAADKLVTTLADALDELRPFAALDLRPVETAA